MGSPVEPCDFYIQNDKGKFVKDPYLSDQMQLFPDEIDSVRHTLSISYYVGGNPELTERIYRYNEKTKKWKQIK